MQGKCRYHSYRILCVMTGCGGGDWPPLLALAAGLKRRGHDLMVVCDRSTVKAVQNSGLTTICLPQDLDLENVFVPAISRLLSKEEEISQEDDNPLEVWAMSCVDYIKTSLNGRCPALMISSLLGLGLGKILSKDFARPWCFLNPSFCFNSSFTSLREEDFSAMGGQMYRHWLLPLAQTANLVLHATDQIFDSYPKGLPFHHKYVGPLFWEIPGNSQEQLRELSPPLVLIVVSTSPQPGDLAIVKNALGALESMDYRILVTLALGHNKDDLGPLPANVYVTGYIPHSEILPHCRLVISHAGHGIVLKSMVHGIPMVLVPWGRDQPGVAARAKRLGTAVVVPKSECSVPTLTEAIGMILADPKYLERSQALSNRLRNMDGVAVAVEHIERFLKKT